MSFVLWAASRDTGRDTRWRCGPSTGFHAPNVAFLCRGHSFHTSTVTTRSLLQVNPYLNNGTSTHTGQDSRYASAHYILAPPRCNSTPGILTWYTVIYQAYRRGRPKGNSWKRGSVGRGGSARPPSLYTRYPVTVCGTWQRLNCAFPKNT